MYDKLQQLDTRFFDDQQKGKLMSALNNDVSNFETFFDDASESLPLDMKSN